MVIICELAEQLKTVDKMGRCQSSTGIISILLKMWKVTLKFKYIELSSLFLKFTKLGFMSLSVERYRYLSVLRIQTHLNRIWKEICFDFD